MPIPTETISRYANLLRIVLDPNGNPNEQAAARKVMARMTQEHPEIHEAALRQVVADRAGSPPPPPPREESSYDDDPPPFWHREPNPTPPPQGPRPQPNSRPQGPAQRPNLDAFLRGLGPGLLGGVFHSVLNNIGGAQRNQLLGLLTSDWQDLGHLTRVLQHRLHDESPATYGLLVHQAYALVKSGTVNVRVTPTGIEARLAQPA